MKKLTAFILVIAMLAAALFSLCGCETDNGKEANIDPTEAPATDAPTEAPAEAPTEAPTPEPAKRPGAYTELGDYKTKELYSNVTEEYKDFLSDGRVIPGSTVTDRAFGYEVKTSGSFDADYERILSLDKDGDENDILLEQNTEGIRYTWGYNKHSIIKTDGDTVVWERKLSFLPGVFEAGGGVIVITAINKEDGYDQDSIVVLDTDGRLLWTGKPFEKSANKHCDVKAICIGDDGSVAIIGRCGENKEELFLSVYSSLGELVSENAFRTGAYSSSPIALTRCGDGFLAVNEKKYCQDMGSVTDVLFMSGDGTPKSAVTYSIDEWDIHFSSAVEYGGLLYLSGYAVRIAGEKELAPLRDYLLERMPDGKYRADTVSPEWLGKSVREYYKAVLLAVDPSDGHAVFMHTAEGCRSTALVTDGDTLSWSVANILWGRFYTNMSLFNYRIFGLTDVYNVDPEGRIVSVEKTDEPYYDFF